MSKTQYIILALVLALAAGYGLFLYIFPVDPQKAENILPGQELDKGNTEEENTETPPVSINVPQTPKTIIVEKVQRDIREVLNLKDISGGNAEAEAVLSIQDGKLTLSLRASKLPDPGTGGYAGWLYKDGSSIPLYVGPLSRIPSGEFKDSYVLGFQGESELSAYKTVVVTKETTVNDLMPEKKILEGRFK